MSTDKPVSLFKINLGYTFIYLLSIIHCSCAGGDENSINMEKDNPEITMTISAAGKPVLHRNFCVETPELIIFKDGQLVKAYVTPETEFFVWRKGMLDSWQFEQLYNEIVQLGFWEWDVEQINSEIDSIQQYYDVPMYTLNIQFKDKQKKFYARGIEIYYEDWNIQSLENPCKVFDILSEIEATDGIYIPSKIELIVLSSEYEHYEYLDDDENLSTVLWPYDDYPLDGLEYDWKRGPRISVEGDAVASMVELINEYMYFSYKGKNYLVRYRPIF